MDYNQQLGIKSIAETQKKQFGVKGLEMWKFDWVFTKWYEKFIISILCGLGAWKLLGLIFK